MAAPASTCFALGCCRCRDDICTEIVGVDGPTASSAIIGAVETTDKGPSVMEYKRIAVDTSKAVFTVHGVDGQDRPILRRNLKRGEFEAFFAKLAPTEVAMEACACSHHWARTLAALGHQVRLIPPQYVKPFVKRGKNDSADAEAICEAAGRPTMHFVPVKSAAQQAAATPLSVRELLVRQRTQLINALRGHASEFGIVAGRGIERVDGLLEQIVLSDTMPQTAREMLTFLGEQIAQLDEKLATLETRLVAEHRANPQSKLLAGQPGIGPIAAQTLVIKVNPTQFKSGRHFAAWLGLTPKQRSTGGKQRLGRISREGNERLRQLFVVGAMAVIRQARPGSKTASPWLLQLLDRRPRKLVAVALANKMARTAWAMMTSGEAWRMPKAPTAA
jgi:transposase